MHFFGSGKIFRSGATGRNFGPRPFTNYLKQIVRTPHGFCCAAGLGNFASDEKFATSIFGSGAKGQAFSRSKISQAMKSWQKVFFGPGLRGKIFGGEKCRKR